MDRMCPGAAWLLVSCFFLSVDSHTGKISPPQTPSLKWNTEFRPELSWEPPEDLMTGCIYEVSVKDIKSPTENRTWSKWVVMNGGFLSFAVRTKCNDTQSEPAVYNNSFPDLVKAWNCYIYARGRAYCSWEPAPDASHVRFYYHLTTEGPGGSISDLRECQSYKYHDDGKRGCEIESGHRVYIMFNETRNNSRVWNTYERLLLGDVRPPALNWTVDKTIKEFIIAWSPPDIGYEVDWKYSISYTQCEETKVIEVLETSFQLARLPHCPYRMAIKATSRDGGGSPWSEEKRFDADLNPRVAVFVIVPLLFACLATLAFVCCRKNKESIFPKIPQPRDLLSDIADNNNKSTVCNMYVPATEEESCKITLMSDRQVNNLTTDS